MGLLAVASPIPKRFGEELHSRAVEIRARDPLAVFLLDTFNRQARDRAWRAGLAQEEGDRRLALELARAAEAAIENGCKVRAAIKGEDYHPNTS